MGVQFHGIKKNSTGSGRASGFASEEMGVELVISKWGLTRNDATKIYSIPIPYMEMQKTCQLLDDFDYYN
jgi:hypothetical protein